MISRLKKERMLKGKTQYGLELETGIHQTSISLFERGIRNPNPLQKKQLSEALGVRKDFLFPGGSD